MCSKIAIIIGESGVCIFWAELFVYFFLGWLTCPWSRVSEVLFKCQVWVEWKLDFFLKGGGAVYNDMWMNLYFILHLLLDKIVDLSLLSTKNTMKFPKCRNCSKCRTWETYVVEDHSQIKYSNKTFFLQTRFVLKFNIAPDSTRVMEHNLWAVRRRRK